jgi:fumarate hydratase, class II
MHRLFKISNDIRLLSCGPRAGFHELSIPSNEPGSSIMPGKVNPTQCEALAMVSAQVMANDVAVNIGGSAGYLEMNVYKPLIIYNIMHSIELMSDSCNNFTKFLLIGTKANKKKIDQYLHESLMLVTALSPIIGYDKASKLAHYADDNDTSLLEANKTLGFLSQEEFDKALDPYKMAYPHKN